MVSYSEISYGVEITDIDKTSFTRRWGSPFHHFSNDSKAGIEKGELQRFPYLKPKLDTVSYDKILSGFCLRGSEDQFHEALAALCFRHPEDQDVAALPATSVLKKLVKHGKLQRNAR
jgi:hypothetical protein